MGYKYKTISYSPQSKNNEKMYLKRKSFFPCKNKILFALYFDEKYWFVGKNEIHNYKALQVIFAFILSWQSKDPLQRGIYKVTHTHTLWTRNIRPLYKYNICFIFVLTDSIHSKDFLETLNFGILLGKLAVNRLWSLNTGT